MLSINIQKAEFPWFRLANSIGCESGWQIGLKSLPLQLIASMQFAFVQSNATNWVIRCRESVENEFVHCSLFTAN